MCRITQYSVVLRSAWKCNVKFANGPSAMQPYGFTPSPPNPVTGSNIDAFLMFLTSWISFQYLRENYLSCILGQTGSRIGHVRHRSFIATLLPEHCLVDFQVIPMPWKKRALYGLSRLSVCSGELAVSTTKCM